MGVHFYHLGTIAFSLFDYSVIYTHTSNAISVPIGGARFQNLGEMMTLGRNDAAISPSFIDGLTLEGSVGHTGKLGPCVILHYVGYKIK